MTDKQKRVILVTVTFNSSHFFKRLTEAVAAETYKIEKLIVVDNASSEEHRSVIETLAGQYSFIEIVTSDCNLGGAGGFEKGIKYILEQKYECDYIWIMDDDAYPRPDCLEILVKHINYETGAVVPMIFGVEFQKFQFFHHKRESRYLNSDISLGTKLDDFYDGMEIEANAFVGPLIKLSVVKDVGLPDGGLFIYGDDVEYMYRISRKYRVILVKDAVINHRDTKTEAKTVNEKNIWKEYYKFRNRFLFIQKYKKSFTYGFIGKAFVVKQVLGEIYRTVRNPQYKNVRKPRLYCLTKAVRDGILNKNGKTVDPQKFNAVYGL